MSRDSRINAATAIALVVLLLTTISIAPISCAPQPAFANPAPFIPVPEPATYGLIASAILFAIIACRRTRK